MTSYDAIRRLDLSFTVVIPAFNCADSVKRAITSADLAGAEAVIVVDDGSTDCTLEVADRLGAMTVSQANSGAYAARERGVSLVNTENVILLDADDELIPEGVAQAISFLKGQHSVGLVVGRYIERGSRGYTRQNLRTSDEITPERLVKIGYAPAPPAAIVWRTEALRTALDSSPSALKPRYAEDYELLIRASATSRVGRVDSNVCIYSVGTGRSAQNQREQEADVLKIQDYYSVKFGTSFEPRSNRARLASRIRTRARVGRLNGKLMRPILDYLFSYLIHPSDARITFEMKSLVSLGRGVAITIAAEEVFQDWKVNEGDRRVQVCLALFRIAARARYPRDKPPRARSVPVGILYRFTVQWLLGIDLPWRTQVGSRLRIFHGYGLVVNDDVIIGSDVTLRHGVTIGHRYAGGEVPSVGDRASFGPNSTILGRVTIGSDAAIAAGSVVLSDVAPGEKYRGFPDHWNSTGSGSE